MPDIFMVPLTFAVALFTMISGSFSVAEVLVETPASQSRQGTEHRRLVRDHRVAVTEVGGISSPLSVHHASDPKKPGALVKQTTKLQKLPKNHDETSQVALKFYETSQVAPKFFHEDPRDGHLDYECSHSNKQLPSQEERIATITQLLRSFVKIAGEHNIKPILFRGLLIGYRWNKQPLPWDNDGDLAFSYDDMLTLQGLGSGTVDFKDTVLRLNPNWADVSKKLYTNNRIDARFVNKTNGVYLDLVALSPHFAPDVYGNKSHAGRFQESSIWPLKQDTFAGAQLYIPHDVDHILETNYGHQVFSDVFVQRQTHGASKRWKFDKHKAKWVAQ